MSVPAALELKWDVPSLEMLRELVQRRLPLGLPSTEPLQTFHRDVYFDTPEGSLARRGIVCCWRLGADDRRTLRVGFPGAPFVTSEVPELDHSAAFAGASEAARRLRGAADPATLQVLAELEVERITRHSRSRWPWRGHFTFVYDAVSVRRSGIARTFQELKIRRTRQGTPALERISEVISAIPGLRLMLEPKLARGQRIAAALESEALSRALASGRSVILLALDRARVALRRTGSELRLPVAEGQGEAAGRHLLREVTGSGVGDLALLGTIPGAGPTRLLDVWIARRVRRDRESPDSVEWLGLEEVVARAGGPGLADAETLAAIAFALRSGVAPDPVPAPLPADDRPLPPAQPPDVPDDALLLDPDLSLVEFNLRVLALAEDRRTPLLERLGFLAIVSANLDEFFMVNAGALKAEQHHGRIEAIALRLRPLLARQQQCLGECLDELAGHGISVRSWANLSDSEGARLAERFEREVYPLVTPRAITVSPGFPVPLLPHLTLCLAVTLTDADAGPTHFAYLRIPDRLARFIPTGDGANVIPIEEVVRANVGAFYPGRTIAGVHLFRLTRAAEIDLEDQDAGDLLQAMREAVGSRASNAVIRLEVEREMPASVRDRIRWELRFERRAEISAVADGDVYEVDGLLDLRGLRELMSARVSGGRFPALQGRDPFKGDTAVWRRLEQGDVLVHHPYDDFVASVVRFFSEAADDPAVISIRLTLYRVGEPSPIVDALLRARAAGKDVTVFVELKARFDESRNIAWVQRLEDAGVPVVYGVVGLKNHAKVGLVLRREGDTLHRFVHIGTGNYNASTARQYTDLGLLSADPDLGADVHDLFNELTGSSHPPGGSYHRIMVAPKHLLSWLLAAIDAEREHARAGRPAGIRAKLNGLADTEVVQALYAASEDGVKIELIVRGICTLRPGLPGHSSQIRVVSNLGRFLEHARIYQFTNGGAEQFFIGSADWRPRNLRRRVEVVAPVTGEELCGRLRTILDLDLSDENGWELQPDGRYERATSESTSTAHQK